MQFTSNIRFLKRTIEDVLTDTMSCSINDSLLDFSRNISDLWKNTVAETSSRQLDIFDIFEDIFLEN